MKKPMVGKKGAPMRPDKGSKTAPAFMQKKTSGKAAPMKNNAPAPKARKAMGKKLSGIPV